MNTCENQRGMGDIWQGENVQGKKCPWLDKSRGEMVEEELSETGDGSLLRNPVMVSLPWGLWTSGPFSVCRWCTPRKGVLYCSKCTDC